MKVIRIAGMVALLLAHIPVLSMAVSTKTTRIPSSASGFSPHTACALSASGSGEPALVVSSFDSGVCRPVRLRLPYEALPPGISVLIEADITVATGRPSWIQPGSGTVTARLESITASQPSETFDESLGEATPLVYSAECGGVQGPPPAPLTLVPFPGLEENMAGYLQREGGWYTQLAPWNTNYIVLESVNNDTMFQVEYVDLTLRYIAPPVLEFVNPGPLSAADTRHVLISKAGTEAYPNSGQTADREIEIQVKVTRDSLPSPDENIYFVPVDPADAPPNADNYYIPAALRTAGDNRDTAVGAGTLSASHATTGADGIARVKLTVTSRVAGDNYQVKASLDPKLLENAPGVQSITSATLTAWKRVYVEVDRMAKSGTYLRSTIGAQATEVPVVNAGIFSAGEHALLIHAPPLGSGQKTFYSQEVIVKQADKKNNVLKLNVTNPLYTVTAPFDGPVSGSPHLADAVVRPSAGWFSVNTANLASTWNAAFTDVVYTTDDPVPYIPYEAEVAGGAASTAPTAEFVHLARKWHYHDVDANHLHLIAGSRTVDPLTLGEASSRYNNTNMAWIFEQTVNNNAPAGDGELRLNAEATVHEMTHLWQVEHCTEKEFDSTHFCTMSDGSIWKSCGGATCQDFFDGTTRFHFIAPEDSEYLWIRKRPDPFPESVVSNP